MVYNISTFPTWTANWFLSDSMNSILVLPYGYQPWLCSIVAAILVGIAGIVPLLFIPADYDDKKNKNVSGLNLQQLLLSFAVGGLLADVFLHLLPEAWTAAINGGSSPNEAFTCVGLCVLSGIFVFIVVEMMATTDSGAISSSCTIVDSSYETSSSSEGDVYLTKEVTPMNGVKLSYSLPYNSVGKNKSGLQHQQKHHKQHQHQHQYQQRQRQVQKKNSSKSEDSVGKNKVIGYLNLIANGIDNFAHGLAVAGSFMVSYKTGVLTTTAILIHEIPHEIGDFAILLKSGFTRWEAAWAQIYTAFIGLLGALLTLFLGTAEFMGCFQVYVLGFTAGAFLNIALVSVLPDLLQEERPFHSAAQLGSLLLGTLTMSSVALFC